MSLRYKTIDHLWFTFFHEAKRVLEEHKMTIFLDSPNYKNDFDHEARANAFAAQILIPPEEMREFLKKYSLSKASITRFARSIGISPGIVVGRLQHMGKLPHAHCNDLKRKLEWR